MASWIVGDIHGCADELGSLLGRLALGPEDRLLSVGDLFHRGPDPAGVMDLMRESGARFVLGNHELRVLERFDLAPTVADASDRPPRRTSFGDLDPESLRGDGGRACDVPAHRRGEVLEFLQDHEGFFLEQRGVAGAGRTRDDRAWCIVHAGVLPGRRLADHGVFELTRLQRLSGRGRPFWYEIYTGPDLVLFGHTPSKIPRVHRHGGAAVAIGLDTGCVYGGSLTAYSPELDEFVRVPAKRAYASKWGERKWTAAR